MRFPQLLISPNALAFLILCFLSFDASALQMGPLDSRSRIGEPLNASVGLWLNSEEKSQAVRLTVSPDLAYHRNSGLTQIVNQIEARLEQSANGNAFVSITTKSPVTEPIVAFRLKISIGNNAIMRTYAAALNPASTRAQSRTKVSTRRTTRTSAKKSDPINDSTYVVSSGDTLWGIARRVSRSNTSAEVEKIFTANPDAFVNGDRNKLKLGAKLILSQLLGATSGQTESVVLETTVPEAIGVTENVSVAAQSTSARTERTASHASVVDWKLRKPEVAAELAALEQKYAALRARFSSQSVAISAASIIATGEAQPTSTEAVTNDSQNSAGSPGVAATAAPESDKILQPEPSQSNSAAGTFGAGQNVTNEDIDMAAERGIFASILSSTSLQYSFFIILAVCSIILLGFIARKELRLLGNRRAEHKFKTHEKTRRAEVALKAKNRIQNESNSGEVDAAPDRGIATELLGETGSLKDTDVKEANIDINIAHGRYDEAEKSLLDVISAAPRNYSAKLRLIEVYYMTERISEFCALADDLQNNHRVDMADEEWRRVIRMGKIIAPDEVRFSGPRAVENSPYSA
ncbi:MAG: pilus assembly protein FimV [Gammaproteobacteria bacterium]|jgi:pilus assembly protein FimV